MRHNTRWIPLPLSGLALAAGGLLTACPAEVTVSVRPTTPPPAVRDIIRKCPPTHYARMGRYHWVDGRYVFRAGRCVPRPSRWHAAYRWVDGRWVRAGDHYEYRAGREHCPPRVIPRHPTSPPPPPRPMARSCGGDEYARAGTWSWVRGQWRWRPGRCVKRPAGWRARHCRWQVGRWRKQGRRMVHAPGRMMCKHATVPDYPTRRPPAPPTITYPKCPRRAYRVDGRYVWNVAHKRYVWRPPYCFRRPYKLRRCTLTPGRWELKAGRATWVAGAWKCKRGKPLPHAQVVKKYVKTFEPRRLPPRPRRVRKPSCGRGPYFVYPGGWRWSRVLRKYVWEKPRCVAIPRPYRGCKFQRGKWRRVGKRIVFAQGGWKCKGKALVGFTRSGAVRVKATRCPPRTRWVAGVGLRAGACKPLPRVKPRVKPRVTPRRCTPAMRRAGRCGRVPPSLRPRGLVKSKGHVATGRCKKGYVRVRGKCVRRGVRRCTPAMRKAGRCR